MLVLQYIVLLVLLFAARLVCVSVQTLAWHACSLLVIGVNSKLKCQSLNFKRSNPHHNSLRDNFRVEEMI